MARRPMAWWLGRRESVNVPTSLPLALRQFQVWSVRRLKPERLATHRKNVELHLRRRIAYYGFVAFPLLPCEIYS